MATTTTNWADKIKSSIASKTKTSSSSTSLPSVSGLSSSANTAKFKIHSKGFTKLSDSYNKIYNTFMQESFEGLDDDTRYNQAYTTAQNAYNAWNTELDDYYKSLDTSDPYYSSLTELYNGMKSDTANTMEDWQTKRDSYKTEWQNYIEEQQAAYEKDQRSKYYTDRHWNYAVDDQGNYVTDENGNIQRTYSTDYDTYIATADPNTLSATEKAYQQFLTAEDNEAALAALDVWESAMSGAEAEQKTIQAKYDAAQEKVDAAEQALEPYKVYLDSPDTPYYTKAQQLKKAYDAAQAEYDTVKTEYDNTMGFLTGSESAIKTYRSNIEGAQELNELSDEAYELITKYADMMSSYTKENPNSRKFSDEDLDTLHQLGLDDDTIMRLVEARRNQVDEDYMAEKVQKMAEYAAEHPFLASALSVGTNLISGVGYLDMLNQKIDNAWNGTDNPINYNTLANSYSAQTSAIRGQVASDLENSDKWYGGSTASFLYQTGMSMVDSGLNVALASALGAVGIPAASSISTALMASSATTSAVLAAHERGLTDNQALSLGLVAGIAEYATEKVSLETLLNKVNLVGTTGAGKASAAVANYLLHNVVTEGSEEVASDVINFIADTIVSKDAAEWKQAARMHADETGCSMTEAYNWALQQELLEAGVSFLGGAISGGVMGGVSSGLNYAGSKLVQTKVNTANAIINSDAALAAANSEVNKLKAELSEITDSNSDAYKAKATELAEAEANLESVSANNPVAKALNNFNKVVGGYPGNGASESAMDSWQSKYTDAQKQLNRALNEFKNSNATEYNKAVKLVGEATKFYNEQKKAAKAEGKDASAFIKSTQKQGTKAVESIAEKVTTATEAKTDTTQTLDESKAAAVSEENQSFSTEGYDSGYSNQMKNLAALYEKTGTLNGQTCKEILSSNGTAMRTELGITPQMLVGKTRAQQYDVVRNAVANKITQDKEAVIAPQKAAVEKKKAEEAAKAEKARRGSLTNRQRASEDLRKANSLEEFAERYRADHKDATDAEIKEAYENAIEDEAMSAVKAIIEYKVNGETEYRSLSYKDFRAYLSERLKKEGIKYTEEQYRQAYEKLAERYDELYQKYTEKQQAKMKAIASDLNARLEDLHAKVEISYDKDLFRTDNPGVVINAFVRTEKGKNIICFNGNVVTRASAIYSTLGHELFHPTAKTKVGNKAVLDRAIGDIKVLNSKGALDGYIMNLQTLKPGASVSELLKDYENTVKFYQDAYQAQYDREAEAKSTKEHKVEARVCTVKEAEEEFICDIMSVVFDRNETKFAQELTHRDPGTSAHLVDIMTRMRMTKEGRNQDKDSEKILKNLMETWENALKLESRFNEQNIEEKVKAGETVAVPDPTQPQDSITLYYNKNHKTYMAGDEQAVAWSKDENGNLRPTEASGREILLSLLRGERLQTGDRSYIKNVDADGKNVLSHIDENGKEVPGLSEKQIETIIGFMDKAAEFMRKAGVQYQFINLKEVEDTKLIVRRDASGTPISIGLSCRLKNGEYPVNFDFTSICKRREAAAKYINEILSENDADEIDLSKENLLKINNILRDEGYDTACLGCFVEAKRFFMQDFAEKFADMWNDILDELVDEIGPVTDYFGFSDESTLVYDDDVANALDTIGNFKDANKSLEAAKQKYLDERINEMLNRKEKLLTESEHLDILESLANANADLERRRIYDPDAKIDTDKFVSEKKCAYFHELFENGKPYSDKDVQYLKAKKVFGSPKAVVREQVRNLIKTSSVLQKRMDYRDIMTTHGLRKLTEISNEIVSLLKQSYGSGAPKLTNGYVPYNNEIAYIPDTKSNLPLEEYLAKIAGIRSQSFSDFKIEYIFDYLQMAAEMTARHLSAHMYTKELDCAMILGMCGIKVNMSLMYNVEDAEYWENAGIPDSLRYDEYGHEMTGEEVAKHYAGCRFENGEIVYNYADKAHSDAIYEASNHKIRPAIQSIDVEGAYALQKDPRYSKNVGTIAVGFSDYHIRMLMADPNIRYIIPYHPSGLPAAIASSKGVNLTYAGKYTSTQNTTKISEIRDQNKKKIAYDRSQFDTLDEFVAWVKQNNYIVTTTKAEKGHGSFDLYGDLAKTRNPKLTAANYAEYCFSHGMLPVFYQFYDDENYYKVLYDFAVYDADGNYAPQEAVHLWEIDDNGKVEFSGLEKNAFSENGIVDKTMKRENDRNEILWAPEKRAETKQRILDAVKVEKADIAKDKKEFKAVNEAAKVLDPESATESDFKMSITVKSDGVGSDTGADILAMLNEVITIPENMKKMATANPAAFRAWLLKGAYDPKTNPNGNYYVTYRTMQVINDIRTGYKDALLPPMSTVDTNGEFSDSSELFSWEAAVADAEEEIRALMNSTINGNAKWSKTVDKKEIVFRPEGSTTDTQSKAGKAQNKAAWEKFFADRSETVEDIKAALNTIIAQGFKPKYKLQKGEPGDNCWAAYNPYLHSCNMVLNDQFSGAYLRENLRVVLCVVPISENHAKNKKLGTHRAFAKNATGWSNWKAGAVGSQLTHNGGTIRRLYLSRWMMPVQIIDTETVADMYVETLNTAKAGHKPYVIPANTVCPAMLEALEERIPDEISYIKTAPSEDYPDGQYEGSYIERLISKLVGNELTDTQRVAMKESLDKAINIERTRGNVVEDERLTKIGVNGENIRYSMTGVKAKHTQTAKENLQVAVDMEQAGLDSEKIRLATGWFRSYDGMWRYEIDDSGAKLDYRMFENTGDAARIEDILADIGREDFETAKKDYDEAFAEYNAAADKGAVFSDDATQALWKKMTAAEKTYNEAERKLNRSFRGYLWLSDILDHPKLFKAYPQLKQLKVTIAPEMGNTMGYADNSRNLICIQPGRSESETLDTIMHEIQHAIQGIEGFASGSNVALWGKLYWVTSDYTKDAISRVSKAWEEIKAANRLYKGDDDRNRPAFVAEEYRAIKEKQIEAKRNHDEQSLEHYKTQASELETKAKEAGYYDAMVDYYWAAVDMTIGSMQDKEDSKSNANLLYIKTAGEIEARNVAARRELTKKQRKETRPNIDEAGVVFTESKFSVLSPVGFSRDTALQAYSTAAEDVKRSMTINAPLSVAAKTDPPPSLTYRTINNRNYDISKYRQQLIDTYIQDYGEIEQTGRRNAREVHIPRSVGNGERIAKAAETIASSAAIKAEHLKTIDDVVLKGGASYFSVDNKTLERNAEKHIREVGFDTAMNEFIKAAYEDKVTDDLVALGAVLMNNYNNAPNINADKLADLFAAAIRMSHNSAVGLQAQNIIKKLTPTARLYAITKDLEQLQQGDMTDSEKAELEEDWTSDVGEKLAKYIAAKYKVTDEKAKSMADLMLSDLKRFAKDTLPKTNPNTKRRTNMDRIQELFNNYADYKNAWDTAKDVILDAFGYEEGTPEADDALELLKDWRNDALDVADRLTKEFTDKAGLHIPPELANQYLSAETDEERDMVLDNIYEALAIQMADNLKFKDKLRSYRYLAMLGNFKTQIRNVVGNAGFKYTRMMKECVSGIIETLAPMNERTTSAVRDKATLTNADAIQTCKDCMDLIMRGGKYQEMSNRTLTAEGIERHMTGRRFGNTKSAKTSVGRGARWLLNNWSELTDKAMGEGFSLFGLTVFGDEKFCRAAFMDSLSRTMAANNTTWSVADEALKTKAIERAVLEAAKATYRDVNQFSKAISNLRFRNPKKATEKAINAIAEGIIPFRKTPANILVRAVEYSPVNLANALFQTIAYKIGYGVDKEGNVKFTANDVVDTWSSAITGSLLTWLGYGLASGMLKALGISLHGRKDDDDPLATFETLEGIQEYSIEINGHTYTLDWLAPECVPLLLGATVYEVKQDKNLDFKDALSVLNTLTDPLLEMSMLQGINDAFENASDYSGNGALMVFTVNSLWSAITQFVPTIVGQAERAFNNIRQSTYTDKNKDLPTTYQKALGKLSAKVPGWDYAQINYTDAWGRVQLNQDTETANALYQFLAPWYSTTIEESDMERKLVELYEETGDDTVLIEAAGKYFKVYTDETKEELEEKNLTGTEYVTYNTTRGQLAYSAVTEFTESEEWNNLTAKQRVAVITGIYGYATDVAKLTVTDMAYVGDTTEKVQAALDSGLSIYDYYVAKVITEDTEAWVDDNGDKISNSQDLQQMQQIYAAYPNATKEKYQALFTAAGISKSLQGYSSAMVNSKVSAMQRYGSLSVAGATGVDSVDSEIERLANAGYEDSIQLSASSSKIKVSSDATAQDASNDTTYEMTDEEYEQYDTTRRETQTNMLSGLVNNSLYTSLSDAEKAKVIGQVNSYANATAAVSVSSDYVPNSTYIKGQTAEEAGISLTEYFVAYAVKNSTDTKLVEEDGSTVNNSQNLYRMREIYNTVTGLTASEYVALFELLGIGKTVKSYTKAEVEEAIAKLESKYAAYN